MNNLGVFQREKRHPSQMYHPMQHSVANYWTETFQKREMKHDFNEDLFLNNIHLIPDPLKKNLADSLFNNETFKKLEKRYQNDQKMDHNNKEVPLENPPKHTTTLGGIGSFFSGVVNVLTSVMFPTRAPDYYDCFDVDSQGQAWQRASSDVQDKNGASDCNSYDVPPKPNGSSDMNFDSRAAVTGCERKLNQVLHLLAPNKTSSPVWVRKRPKKEFIEPGSVEESFEDAFSPEDFCNLPNDAYIEYYCPVHYHSEAFCGTTAQKTKFNVAPVEENTDIIRDVTKNDLETKTDEIQVEKDCLHIEKDSVQMEKDSVQMKKDNVQLENNSVQLKKECVQLENNKDTLEQQKLVEKSELNTEQQSENNNLDLAQTKSCQTIRSHLVSSCEDKLSKLKALLKLKRENTEMTQPEDSQMKSPKFKPKDTKTADKHFKNPNRRCGKRSKAKLKCRIEDDLVFASEINVGTPPSAENSPVQHNVSFGDYFDEVSGRFRTSSTCSDDSFQIVFNEHSASRLRKSSDCESEDSFIVFEDSPESCYVSNDVFDSDTESEISDSGCGLTCKLKHTLTRTFDNLADDTLYESEDEVDFAVETPVATEEKTGLLLNEKKKQLRKRQPPKRVHFSPAPPKVHVMRVWTYAARQARAGHWERYAVDRERFKRRIADAEMALSWVLKPQHRSRVMFQRFMPWWNQLKRKELAVKKEAEERRKEEEKQNEVRREEERQNDNRADDAQVSRYEEEKRMEEWSDDEKEGRSDEEEQKKGRRDEADERDNENKQEAERSQVNPTKDVEKENVNEKKSKRKTKEDIVKEIILQNESVQEELNVISTENNILESIRKSFDGNDKISSNMIIEDALTKNIENLKTSDDTNIKVVGS